EFIFFGIMLIVHSIAILIDDDMVFQLNIPIDWYHRLLNILFLATIFTLLLFIRSTLQIKSKFFKYIPALFILNLFTFIFLPIDYFLANLQFMMITGLTMLFFLYINTIKAYRQGVEGALYTLLLLTSFTSNIIWGNINNANIYEIPYYPFDFIFSVF